jgi:hypothetical protein
MVSEGSFGDAMHMTCNEHGNVTGGRPEGTPIPELTQPSVT